MEDRQPRNRRQFTAEFKRDAVELVRTSGRPIAEIARELGIDDSTLGNWVRQDRIDRGEQEGLSSDEQTRLGELVSRQATFALFDACAQTGGGSWSGSACKVKPWLYVEDARRGDGGSHVRWPRITPCHVRTGLRG
jgi:transposase